MTSFSIRLCWLRFAGRLANLIGLPGVVREVEYVSQDGLFVRVRTSPFFTVVMVGGVEVYFYRLTGGIDGIGLSNSPTRTGEAP